MPRATTARKHGKKISVSVTLDPDLYKWATSRVGAGKEFASLSHAVERGLAFLREGDAIHRTGRER